MVYLIKKTMQKGGRISRVFMTNSHSEILEIPQRNVVHKLVEVLNENSDSACSYEVVSIASRKEI